MTEEKISVIRMDILDQFACAVVTGMIADPSFNKANDEQLWETAYEVAMAGLEAKAKRRTPFND